jgi:hypothetical protein
MQQSNEMGVVRIELTEADRKLLQLIIKKVATGANVSGHRRF